MLHMSLSSTSLFCWSTGILLSDHLDFWITMRLTLLILMVKTLQLRRRMVSVQCRNIHVLFCVILSFVMLTCLFSQPLQKHHFQRKLKGVLKAKTSLMHSMYVQSMWTLSQAENSRDPGANLARVAVTLMVWKTTHVDKVLCRHSSLCQYLSFNFEIIFTDLPQYLKIIIYVLMVSFIILVSSFIICLGKRSESYLHVHDLFLKWVEHVFNLKLDCFSSGSGTSARTCVMWNSSCPLALSCPW